MELDTDRIDAAVLGCCCWACTMAARALKTFDWDAMNRLHREGVHLRSCRQGQVRRAY